MWNNVKQPQWSVAGTEVRRPVEFTDYLTQGVGRGSE